MRMPEGAGGIMEKRGVPGAIGGPSTAGKCRGVPRPGDGMGTEFPP